MPVASAHHEYKGKLIELKLLILKKSISWLPDSRTNMHNESSLIIGRELKKKKMRKVSLKD